MIENESEENLIYWHDEFCRRNLDFIPIFPYDYHQVYGEIIRRSELEYKKDEDNNE